MSEPLNSLPFDLSSRFVAVGVQGSIRNALWHLNQQFLTLLLLFLACKPAYAQPLEDVRLEYQVSGIVATIRMSEPVEYKKHFPERHGRILEIFYDPAPGATNPEKWVDNETRNSPPSMLIPAFTVTTRNQHTQPKLVIEFVREADFDVGPGKDSRSLIITIRPDKVPNSKVAIPDLPTIMPEKPVDSAATLTEDEANLASNNSKARVLMVQGRDALQAGNNEAAVDAFNKLLLLPPNEYTQDGQEWVGVARERAKQIDKARTEYDLYLKIYPEGSGAARVVQRLVGMAGQKDTVKPDNIVAKKKNPLARWLSYGGISSRYYYSQRNTDSTDPFNNTLSTTTQDMVDQSMLINSLDASSRYMSEEYDNRLVFRDVNTLNFLGNQPNQNRVYAAYGEVKNRLNHYQFRVGRQSSSGNGVLGRYDGLSASYGDPSKLSFGGEAGALSEATQGSKPVFAGANITMGSVTLYGINQRFEGINERSAIGAELRYFEGRSTAFALLDYDTYFKALNVAQVMGSVDSMGGTVNFMLDHRRSPMLSTRNALNGAGTSSVSNLLQSMTPGSLRQLAEARTATTNMGQIGYSVPFQEKWKVSGDVRLMNTSGLPASGTNILEGILEATPGRGTEKSVTGQIIGSSLFLDKDIWSGSVTLNNSNSVNSNAVYLYGYFQLIDALTINPSMQIYRQKDQFGGRTSNISSMLHSAYRLKEQLFIDADIGIDFGKFDGNQLSSRTRRTFFSTGFRWDF